MGDSEFVRWCIACFVTDLSENKSVENCCLEHEHDRQQFQLSSVHTRFVDLDLTHWYITGRGHLILLWMVMLWCRQAAFHYLFDALPLAQFAAKPQSCGFTINYLYSLPAGTKPTGSYGSHTIQRKIYKGTHHRRNPYRARRRYPPTWARGVFKDPSNSINENN